ncbi:hypothetical protein [Actinokineospora sp. NPDC004072]
MRRHCLVLLAGTTLLLAGCGDQGIPELLAARMPLTTTETPATTADPGAGTTAQAPPTTDPAATSTDTAVPGTTPLDTTAPTTAPTTGPDTTEPETTAPEATTAAPTTTAEPQPVRVTAGAEVAVPEGTGVSSVQVAEIQGDRVTLTGTTTGTNFTGICLRSCSITALNQDFTIQLGPGGGAVLNDLRIDLLGVDGVVAILRVVKA